jgi:hypothetical protein
MKLTFGVLVAIFVIFEAVVALQATTYQPQNLGWVNIAISSGTQAQIDNSTATEVGRLKFCSNCGGGGGSGTICVSTQTTGFHGFVLSTGTLCK